MAIEIDYYITMVSKNTSFVNIKGSSLIFSAQGGRGKEKKLSAEKIGSPSEGAAEGGCGGNPAAPELEAKPRRLPESLRAETSKNIFFSLIEKSWGWRAKSKNAKKMFLLGTRALRAAAGRSVSFVQEFLIKIGSSQIVSSQIVKTQK